MHRIMLVDDETNILHALRRALPHELHYEGAAFPITMEAFSEPEAALQRATETAFDAVISDYRMPAMNGVEFLTGLKTIQPQIARIILSGYADLQALVGAINEAQIFRFIAKPWSDYELKSALAQALAYRAVTLENQRLADEVRVQRGQLSRQAMELRRLEEEHPGITRVNWGPDGSILVEGWDE
ncbi:MAG: response regulator [Betaproteobacteria bacterium]|nr:response regulator [Betaproteobacteria bacterium]